MKRIIFLALIVIFAQSCKKNECPLPQQESVKESIEWKFMLTKKTHESEKHYLTLMILSDFTLEHVAFQASIHINYMYEEKNVGGIYNQNSFEEISRGEQVNGKFRYFIVSKQPIINFEMNGWPLPLDPLELLEVKLLEGNTIIDGVKFLFKEKEYIIPEP